MIRWLHISDLHIRKQADWINYNKEIIKKCHKIGQIDFIIVTGDFHDFREKEDFEKAAEFLEKLTKELGVDIVQDLFLIPGNHDGVSEVDDKEVYIQATQHKPVDVSKKLSKLLGAFSDYEKFVKKLIPNYPHEHPAAVHVRNWRNKINLIHCNTAIAADGKEKINQLVDIDGLAGVPIDDRYPSFLLAHNSFFDLHEEHQKRVRDIVRLNNIRAYLCGDRHKESVDQIAYENNQNKQIPCITSFKSAPDPQDEYSRFGIIIGEWDTEIALIRAWEWKAGEGFNVNGKISDKEIDMGINLNSLEGASDNGDDIKRGQDKESVLEEEKGQRFMDRYKQGFLEEADEIKNTIDTLKATHYVDITEVDEIIDMLESIRRKGADIYKSQVVLKKVYDILLFIQGLKNEQLVYLNDIGLKIPIQVTSGQAQAYAADFFKYYFEDKKDNTKVRVQNYCHDYMWEQMIRMVRSYKIIVNFNKEIIQFSDYYVYPNIQNEKLLAVSVSGETKKILVWNIEVKRHEPVAALGGLYEEVDNVKIYRYKGKIIIGANGKRKLYFWDLSLSKGEPTYILKAHESISDYVIFQSLDSNLSVMGLVENKFCTWRLFESEYPITSFRGENDIYIINTHLSDVEDTYECIGRKSFADNEKPRVMELIERGAKNFDIEVRFEIYNSIDNRVRFVDGFGNRVNAYTLNKKDKVIYLLINNDIYIYDLMDAKLCGILKRDGQRIADTLSTHSDKEVYLLTYSIFQQYYKKDIDLIQCYRLENENITDHKKWSVEAVDVSYATISVINNMPVIYFSHLFSNKINMVNYDSDSYLIFYTLPETFDVRHITSG